MNEILSERPHLRPRARVALSEVIRIAVEEDVEPVDAVERTSFDLGPADRADVALVAEDAIAEIEARRAES